MSNVVIIKKNGRKKKDRRLVQGISLKRRSPFPFISPIYFRKLLPCLPRRNGATIVSLAISSIERTRIPGKKSGIHSG